MNTTVENSSREEIRGNVVHALGSVLGEDAVTVLDVKDSTRLFSDLQLGSIEAVALVEAIGKYYPLSDQLFEWVPKMSYWAMAHLTIGDIVDFIYHAQH